MVVSHDNLSIRSGGGRENPLDSSRCQRQRSLAQYVDPLLQRAEHVRFVEVIGSRDDNGIELVGVEQLIDIGKYVRDAEALGKCACLGSVVVADRDELCTAYARQQREMSQLRYRASANEAKSNVRAQICPTVVP